MFVCVSTATRPNSQPTLSSCGRVRFGTSRIMLAEELDDIVRVREFQMEERLNVLAFLML